MALRTASPSNITADSPVVAWTRVETSDERFVEACADHTDGVVIVHRFDSPPHGDLKAAALRARVPFLIELETWRLPYLRDHDDDSFGSDAQTAVGRAVSLPLTPGTLASDETTQPLIRAAISAQVGAALTFAPDFQIQSKDDPWLEVNLRCLRLTHALAGGRQVGAWIHVTLDALLSGALPAIAARYAHESPPGTFLVLTVSDLRADLGADQLAAYFRGLAAFQTAGFRLVVDRASDVSIPAVAAYAEGCMLGTRIYRTAPPSPIFTSDINPKIRLAYYVGHQGRRVRRDTACNRHLAGRLDACAHPGCQAVIATRRKDNLLLRLHNAHELRNEIRHARDIGVSGLIASWRDAKLKHLRMWAQALDDANARSEEA